MSSVPAAVGGVGRAGSGAAGRAVAADDRGDGRAGARGGGGPEGRGEGSGDGNCSPIIAKTMLHMLAHFKTRQVSLF